jgi:hypothetical protein
MREASEAGAAVGGGGGGGGCSMGGSRWPDRLAERARSTREEYRMATSAAESGAAEGCAPPSMMVAGTGVAEDRSPVRSPTRSPTTAAGGGGGGGGEGGRGRASTGASCAAAGCEKEGGAGALYGVCVGGA